MTRKEVQTSCERGQEMLVQTKYLEAEAILVEAEAQAWEQKDFDTIARLYLPLQEARRQRRQRCGEGVVALGLLAEGPADHVDGRRIIENYPHGQLLVAGWGTIEPAVEVRRLQATHHLYVETFLSAVYPVEDGRVAAVVPLAGVSLPEPSRRPVDELLRLLPPHSIVLHEQELAKESRPGDAQTYAYVMSLWERLHQPFLAASDKLTDPLTKIAGYRRTIEVDYACELAHQKLSDVARELARRQAK